MTTKYHFWTNIGEDINRKEGNYLEESVVFDELVKFAEEAVQEAHHHNRLRKSNNTTKGCVSCIYCKP
jgi:hypothetical protein